MIDIHCHILPGVDDGPETLDEAVAMCRMAAGDGIRSIVATPHFIPGRSESTSSAVSEKMAELKDVLNQEGIPLAILTGADILVTPELGSWLNNGPGITINDKQYFLAELPHTTVPPGWDKFLLSLISAGKIPILTHPERNPWFFGHPEALYDFVSRGGMVQITAMSLTGGCGEYVSEFSRLLLSHNLVHVIATDAHDSETRQPVLSKAFDKAADIVGQSRARALVASIPEAIIEGRSLALSDEAIPITAIGNKKTWLQRLISA